MKIRYVIQVVTRAPCPEPSCYGDRAHELATYSYTLPDGTPISLQPGDVYFSEDHRGKHTCAWDNCDGKHLICICPSKSNYDHPWDIDGRASNCTMKEDRLHRCWVRHGDPAVPGQLHVDKKGLTCAAGAGSIQTHDWHGFLHNGELVP